MSRLDDALIKRFAESEAPRAYAHETKYMAMEILEWRTKAADAAKAAQQSPQAQPPLPGGWGPYSGGIP